MSGTCDILETSGGQLHHMTEQRAHQRVESHSETRHVTSDIEKKTRIHIWSWITHKIMKNNTQKYFVILNTLI